jgi:uncharacterized ferritin-like protein (DUF455 family)
VTRQPQGDTVERWAWEYVHAGALEGKLAPPPPPEHWEGAAEARRVVSPGRPRELRVVAKAKKTRSVATPEGRARALHTFFHHELQAAELMAWAVLAFPETPVDFRAGLVRIAHDEIRHMRIYAEQIARLGFAVGDFEVRDWFWERVPTAQTPASFVAVMGLGLESANLEHAAAFAARFREAGDEEGALAQETVAREEIAHVRFGVTWFETFAARLDFATWRRALPEPLTPLLMRGRPIAREARRKAGQPDAFIDELEAWSPDTPGC